MHRQRALPDGSDAFPSTSSAIGRQEYITDHLTGRCLRQKRVDVEIDPAVCKGFVMLGL
jgi:hypothetical protein